MTVDEMIEKLRQIREVTGGDAELAFDSEHGCCDPMAFNGLATAHRRNSLLPKTQAGGEVVVLHTSGGLS